jgi:hypothetical protein
MTQRIARSSVWNMATSSARSSSQPRRFAPLNPDIKNEADAPTLKGIVFDVDGTLWYV